MLTSPPPPDYFSSSPKEFCYSSAPSFSPEDIFKFNCYGWKPSYNNPFTSSFSLSYPQPDLTLRTLGEGLHELHGNSSSGTPKDNPFTSSFSLSYPQPDFTCRTLGEGLHELHGNSSSGTPKDNPFTSSFSLSYPQPDLTLRTLGEGLHELHGNSSSVTPKAIDDGIALAIVGGWVNISDADGNKPTDTLYGKTASDVCGDSNGKLTTVESMGTAASAHNWNSKEKSSESMAARDTSGEKDTGGGGGGAGENHTCEEFSGRGSCGNACYTCAEADHFARKCILGADCGWSGHHTSGNNTDSYVV
ncbi:hypothetical protein POM88_027628 [Heracleum sosnowskyi]|uniref:CCHC-type domain-containing protein n=1 Tax=Heracleum sosnowskyi TaxID=360622 RepID=A0AAD8MR75_9APIA|nr:hypothetical protein POM88_027627 [Heracleum sosnowskyi]KAK1380884.1 hypothetical protein POM88_027628 [Heracleum sosnowskyi]